MPTYAELDSLKSRVFSAPPRRPLARRVGVEIEVDGPRNALADSLRGAGLASNHRHGACGYHCDDENCFNNHIVHPTSDNSISGPEVVVGGPRGSYVSSHRLHDTIERTCALLLLGGAYTNNQCGGHVHVDIGNLTAVNARLLVRNFVNVEDDLGRLMAANDHQVRVNNNMSRKFSERPPQIDDDWTPEWATGSRSYWMWFTGTDEKDATVEIRGWNGTIMAWRIIMALWVSAALVEAAKQGISSNPGQTILEHLGDFLPPYVQHLVKMQLSHQQSILPYNADAQEILIPVGV